MLLFSDLNELTTERESATNNYCLLLTPEAKQEEDMLAHAITLSPFYLDRSAYIGKNSANYPAIFTLDYGSGEGQDAQYVYHYIDTDVNHTYTFEKDHELIINKSGTELPEHLEAEWEDMERIQRIHEQLMQLVEDIPHQNIVL